MGTHVQFLGRILGDRVGPRQIEQADRVAVLSEMGLLGVDRDAAIIPYPLVRARGHVEQRGLAAIGIADERDVDRFPCLVQKAVDRFVAERSVAGPARGLEGVLGYRDLDEFRLAFAKRDAVAHDFVFDRVEQRGVLDYLDGLAPYESHFGDAVSERPVSEHLRDNCLLGCLQFGQAFV